ncbi:MAG: hypothetical protein PHH83_03585 [Patescibacteria group bacterium]|nr:hypothetical protein [Patescibacteria group bacterium]
MGDRLSEFEKEKAYKLEEIKEVEEEIHFSSDLCDGLFLMRKPCHHIGGTCIHEFGIYHSKSGELIFFHRCDHCLYSVRINQEYYHRARQIYDSGGDYID